ncbi:MAG: filamentous hemagglutinin N-terminal domain-containing protein [Leptolyngbya sp. SIO3F4]|nr:filamentous hemagglutinin N-terminal domain-containing protein [Leptolyngbya sp. SIO3F4]
MNSWKNSWKLFAASLKPLPWIGGFATSIIFSGSSALAQSIIQDSAATLLNGGSSCSGSCTITGGSSSNSNLLHTFQTFNVDTGATVTFDDPGVANIIGQITTVDSNNLSTIDGILAVNGAANLFLINPNGIIFGANAVLDVSGSFIASTAENVVFDSTVINSGDPTIVPLLTLSTPVGLQLGTNSKDIVVNTPTDSAAAFASLRGLPPISGFARLGGFHGQTLAFVGRNVDLTSGAEIQSFDILGPPGGVIHLQATEALTIAGGTVENGLFGNGDGSNQIILDAPTINLTDGSQVVLASAGTGDLGQIDINADTLVIDATDAPRDTFIVTAVLSGSTAESGDINVQTDNIRLINGGRIESRTLGAGDAGNVTIQNSDTIEVSGFGDGGPSGIASTAVIPPAGAGGQVNIDTAKLVVIGGGQIATGTRSSNDAGDLTINASEFVTLEGNTPDGRSGLFANALFLTGSGGNITVNTPYLTLRDGATINVSNSPSSPTSPIPSGRGAAGNIYVQNAEVILLDTQSLLTADTVDGGGANIELEANAVVLKNGSLITTSATGDATGGNIGIETGVVLAIGNSDITANAFNSFGGKISIDAGAVLGAEFRSELTPDNDITAFSEQGSEFSGQVQLITPEIDPTQGVVALPQTLVNREQIQTACGPQLDNTFVASGRGGVPQDASQMLINETVWYDLRGAQEITKNTFETQISLGNEVINDAANNAETALVEAQGWSIDENGAVELLSGTLKNFDQNSLSCLG